MRQRRRPVQPHHHQSQISGYPLLRPWISCFDWAGFVCTSTPSFVCVLREGARSFCHATCAFLRHARRGKKSATRRPKPRPRSSSASPRLAVTRAVQGLNLMDPKGPTRPTNIAACPPQRPCLYSRENGTGPFRRAAVVICPLTGGGAARAGGCCQAVDAVAAAAAMALRHWWVLAGLWENYQQFCGEPRWRSRLDARRTRQTRLFHRVALFGLPHGQVKRTEVVAVSTTAARPASEESLDSTM